MDVNLGVDNNLLILECRPIPARIDTAGTSTQHVPTHLGIELINLGSQSKVNQNDCLFGDGSLVTKSCPTLATSRMVACQTPQVHRISQARIVEWSGLPFPSPGDLPDPGIELTSPVEIGIF